MARLIAKQPMESGLPIRHGACQLDVEDVGCITSIAPFKGKKTAVSESLRTQHGVTLPAAGRSTGGAKARCISTGPGQAFLLGPEPEELSGAAVTNQSDGWAAFRLEGNAAEDVLARLVPIDLRSHVFKRGYTARTLLYHMTISITRTGPNAFLILVFRSMAQTAVHELEIAMKSVAAQA
ncbi:MAG: sarcosine oxidase subunit gamma [Paracoccaceae bacterium]|nr:sarcosine oxidase subunit gamma [Paracoccaceae bacterium]